MLCPELKTVSPIFLRGWPASTDLAYNLWWSRIPEARILFKQASTSLAWKASIHNPVRMLRDTPQEFFLEAEKNEEYLRRYDIIMNRFRRYMNTTTGSVPEEYPGQPGPDHRVLFCRVWPAPFPSHVCPEGWVSLQEIISRSAAISACRS